MMTRYEKVFNTILDELRRAESLQAPLNSPYEGYAVILEELDELWDCIKTNNHEQAAIEARQIGAMAITYTPNNY